MINQFYSLRLSIFPAILLIGLIFTSKIHAEENLGFKVVTPTLKRTQSLKRIFRRYLKPGTKLTKSTPMVAKTIAANPEIKNLNKIEKGTKIVIYLNRSLLRPKKRKKRKKIIAKKTKTKNKKRNFRFSTDSGFVNIEDQDSNTLSMNFIRFGLDYSQKLSENYNYHVGLSAVTYLGLAYSLSDESIEQSNFLPGFKLGVSRQINSQFRLGVNYDYLPYFVLTSSTDTEITFNTQIVHRLNFTPSYSINSDYILLSSIGLVAGAGTGVDGSVGITRSFFKAKKFPLAIAFIAYLSQLEVESRKEGSTAILLSFSTRF